MLTGNGGNKDYLYYLHNLINDDLFSLKNQLSDKEKLGGKLSDDEQSKIEEIINEKIKWLEDNTVSLYKL